MSRFPGARCSCSVASAGALSLPARRAGAADWFRYREAIVIDGLGGPGGGVNDNPDAGLSEQGVKDARVGRHVRAHHCRRCRHDRARHGVHEHRARHRVLGARDRSSSRSARACASPATSPRQRTKRCGLVYGVQDGVAFETDLARLGRSACAGTAGRAADVQPPQSSRRWLSRTGERRPDATA